MERFYRGDRMHCGDTLLVNLRGLCGAQLPHAPNILDTDILVAHILSMVEVITTDEFLGWYMSLQTD